MKAIPSLLMAATAALLVGQATAAAAGFVDVLQTPAQMSALASRSLLQAVTKAGNRLIAVGQRGHIVYSDDTGASWQQAKVPVSSDLTAVFFVGEQKGWAVGHDGVILATTDGGATWTLQLDGRKANEGLLAAMERRVAAEQASEDAKNLLAEARRFQEQGPDKPFLDVWFADENHGYAVGAYNLIVRTSDGGKTWESWFDRTANPKFFNLYAIRPAAGGLYVAGEGGLVLKLIPASGRFEALALPYNGSFFGVAEAGSAVIVYGLRGNVYRSDDGGATWSKVDAGLAATVVASTRTKDGVTLLADVGGRVAGSRDGGRTFVPLALEQPVPLTGITEAGGGKLALVGPRGAAVSGVTPR